MKPPRPRAKTAAAELGIPAEPPPEYVPSELYYPPPDPDTTIEGQLKALKREVFQLRQELASVRASIPSGRLYGQHFCLPHESW